MPLPNWLVELGYPALVAVDTLKPLGWVDISKFDGPICVGDLIGLKTHELPPKYRVEEFNIFVEDDDAIKLGRDIAYFRKNWPSEVTPLFRNKLSPFFGLHIKRYKPHSHFGQPLPLP